jgi:hypothetical protein
LAREFCALASAHAGLDIDAHALVDPSHFRPAEIDGLCDAAATARRALGSAPRRALHETPLDALEHGRARRRAAAGSSRTGLFPQSFLMLSYADGAPWTWRRDKFGEGWGSSVCG